MLGLQMERGTTTNETAIGAPGAGRHLDHPVHGDLHNPLDGHCHLRRPRGGGGIGGRRLHFMTKHPEKKIPFGSSGLR